MGNIKLLFICIVCSLCGFGCTNAGFEKLTSLGSDHSVKCYSGGVVIYDGVSNGKVLSEETSDGYYFEDDNTGKLIEVSGNCVITRL